MAALLPILNPDHGSKCLVPVRRLDNAPAMGYIDETQITIPGKPSHRVRFQTSAFKKKDVSKLSRVGMLKRSIIGARFVRNSTRSGGVKLTENEQTALQTTFRSKFYLTLKSCVAGMGGVCWGPNIVLGINHAHFSDIDQRSPMEQNGRYSVLPPKPSPFMMGPFGVPIPWVAPPLSDNRSIGDWVLILNRFYATDELESTDGVIGNEVVIHRVGQYDFRV